MKSSIKKKYEVNQQEDGSTELVVKGSRSGAFGIASNPVGVAVLLLVVYVGSFFGLMYIGNYFSVRFIDEQMGKSAIGAFAGPIMLLWFVFGPRKNTINLLPQGIKFSNGTKQIARSDIKNIGVMTESVSTNTGHAQTAYVYVDALGQRVKLTGHMNQELAEAIRGEIVSHFNK